MFRLIRRFRPAAVTLQTRRFNILAIHSRFPTTLTYYQAKQSSMLYDVTKRDSRPDALYHEGVRVASDGLVYPGAERESVSHGAVMYPSNTVMMQELARMYFDEYADREEVTPGIEAPHIYTVPKGTPIPSDLILIREYDSKFSLQPSRGMHLSDLNRLLDDFFGRFATKQDADSWLEDHPFELTLSDARESDWMTK
ncbi:hypothetical protein E4U21_002645 [Claviceps maximensis]|nr:hypothetical protein E4U21_002645 [Claviceps maximensis]